MAELNQLISTEKWHIEVMSSIVKAVSDTTLILKGGTALLLIYGLDRFSEDLDFDSQKKIRLENRIRDAIKFPIRIQSIDILKDTDTVTRYRVIYSSPDAKENRLKIEISYRNKLGGTAKIINGIKVYDIPSLIDQKLLALEHRTQARDLYDISFLTKHYSDQFSDTQRKKISLLISDIDSLEKRFMPAFEQDEILSDKDISKIILELSTT